MTARPFDTWEVVRLDDAQVALVAYEQVDAISLQAAAITRVNARAGSFAEGAQFEVAAREAGNLLDQRPQAVTVTVRFQPTLLTSRPKPIS